MCATFASSLPNQSSVIDTDQQSPELGNGIQRDDLQHECVPQLMAAQAATTPNAVAVTHGNLSLTYKELDQRADRLAHFLHALGVGPDVVVGIYLNRSPAMIVAALAIFKAGGAYLPLDPSYPKERLTFLLKDARHPQSQSERFGLPYIYFRVNWPAERC